MRFFAFDSFEGLPEGSEKESGQFQKGEYSASLERFNANLQQAGVDSKDVQAVKGWFKDTLTPETKKKLGLKAAAVIWIDSDLYKSAVPVLDFITDLVVDGTILVFDDWFFFKGNPNKGEQRAFREWLAKNPQSRFPNFTNTSGTVTLLSFTRTSFSVIVGAMKTVLLAVPHYVFASDLLRTNYIKYLSEKYRVVVLSPLFDGEEAKKRGYWQSPNVTYQKWELENVALWDRMKFWRIAFVNEFDYLASIRHFYKRPNYKDSWKRRLARTFGLPFKKFLTADFFTRLEQKKIKPSPIFEEIVKNRNVELLITATPGFSPFEAEMIHLAKRAGLPSVAMNFTWDNLTMNSKHIRKTDYLIAWNEVMKKEASDVHNYLPEKVFVSGTPRFDPYFDDSDAMVGAGKKDPGRSKFLKSKGLNPDYKTIFHTTVTKAYPFQKKYINDLIKLRDSKKIPYVNLLIRTHPLDLIENYSEFKDIPDFCIEKSGKEVEMSYDDLLNLKYSLKYTDVNINYASTITIEACIFDKPVINIGYLDRFALAYEFDHYRPIYESGAIKLAKTDEDLPRMINLYLENPSRDHDQRLAIVDKYVQFTDGLSYKRSVDYLEQII